MKRKLSQLVGSSGPLKISRRKGEEGASTEATLFTKVLAQYGLLESITSHLFVADLYSLAATSRAAHRAIFPREESRLNLLKKMDCDGSGIKIRKQHHQKSRYFYLFGCIEVAKCGTEAKDTDIESRSCISCGVTTCDECRTHCVYQSIFQSPDEDDELPNFSGFVLLNEAERGILSPAHLGGDDPNDLWDCNIHHDQGILDTPLEASFIGAPESIDEIISTDLGTGQLKGTYASNLPHPSPTIQIFWEVTEARKQRVCDPCFQKNAEEHENPQLQCHCTLKARFLDRWLCLKCYQVEEKAQDDSRRGFGANGEAECLCGSQLDDTHARVICLWCQGEVATKSASSTVSSLGLPTETTSGDLQIYEEL